MTWFKASLGSQAILRSVSAAMSLLVVYSHALSLCEFLCLGFSKCRGKRDSTAAITSMEGEDELPCLAARDRFLPHKHQAAILSGYGLPNLQPEQLAALAILWPFWCTDPGSNNYRHGKPWRSSWG